MSFVLYLTNNIGPTMVGVNTFSTIVHLTLITNCDGGALLTTQHTHFYLILCLILHGNLRTPFGARHESTALCRWGVSLKQTQKSEARHKCSRTLNTEWKQICGLQWPTSSNNHQTKEGEQNTPVAACPPPRPTSEADSPLDNTHLVPNTDAAEFKEKLSNGGCISGAQHSHALCHCPPAPCSCSVGTSTSAGRRVNHSMNRSSSTMFHVLQKMD